MMSFGWRPNQSCYAPVGQYQVKQQSLASCEVPGWFWFALAFATVAGLSKGTK